MTRQPPSTSRRQLLTGTAALASLQSAEKPFDVVLLEADGPIWLQGAFEAN